MKHHREIICQYSFKNDGSTFSGFYAAQKWCFENGYSYGSSCAGMPIAIMRGDYNIAKWKNLSTKERSEVDGIMTSFSFREDDVRIILYKKATE